MSEIYMLYDKIYKHYRIVNSIITLGLDTYWRYKTAKKAEEISPHARNILDICCGTGDLTVILKKTFPNSNVYGIDANKNMLEIAKQKYPHIKFILSDVSKIPFDDNYFDIITVSLATRNLFYNQEKFNKVIKEIIRVLKKDGFFINMETTNFSNKFLRFLSHAYIKTVINTVKLFIPESAKSYNFLKESVISFPDSNKFSQILKEKGFSEINTEKLFPGIIAIHTSKK